MSAAVDTGRPPGVPEGARLVTLAELRDRIAGPDGHLRLGPRGSYLRMTMRIFPLGLRGTIRRVTGGVAEAGHRVFSLTYSTGTRTPGNWTNLVFLRPGAAERQLWIWTLDDERAERDLRRRRAVRALHEGEQA